MTPRRDYVIHSDRVILRQGLLLTATIQSSAIMLAAAAAAKLLQLCPTLCDPIDGSPSGSSVPEILQAGVLEWVAIAFSSHHAYIAINYIHPG